MVLEIGLEALALLFGVLGQLLLQATLPTIPATFWDQLIKWIVQVASGFAILYLIIDILRNVFSDERNFKRAGMEIVTTLFLLLIVSKASTVISTLQNWMSAAN